MRNEKIRKCPMCGKKYSEEPAISRRDDETKICSMCGIQEALIDYLKSVEGKKCEDY